MRIRWLVAAAVVLDVALLLLPPGRTILDARAYYDADTALAYLDALGPSGRSAYALHECVDLAFIATYTLLLRALGTRWQAKPRALLFAPSTADVVETAGILVLLAAPSRPLATVVGYATLAKWLTLIVAVVTLVRASLSAARD